MPLLKSTAGAASKSVISLLPDIFRPRASFLRAAKWIGTLTGVAGALIIALNLGVVVFWFALFLVWSVLWSAAGWIQREPRLVVLQGTFTIINVVGIWRWTGV